MVNRVSTELVEQISGFISDGSMFRRSAWLDDGIVQLYLRKSTRFVMINGSMVSTAALDLASIMVDPDHQGKGLFKAVVDHLMTVCPFPILYVENAAEHLIPCLELRGFAIRERMEGINASMFWTKPA